MLAFFAVIVMITLLFFLLLGIKELLPNKTKDNLCVLCSAVILTWITLLSMYYAKIFDEKVIIALLMGGTIVGIYYWCSNKIPFFRLPLFLTLLTSKSGLS